MSNARGQIELSCFGCTDVGVGRNENEDAFLIASLTPSGIELNPNRQESRNANGEIILAVSDGMGKGSVGRLASQLAVNVVLEALRNLPESLGDEIRLKRAVEIANERVWQATQELQSQEMGATMTAAFVQERQVCIAQVGNSRAYLLRDHKLTQLTRDQSLVQNLIEAGVLTLEQAPKFPQRHAILQALGHAPTVKVAMTSLEIRPGDYLLLCSDGLSDELAEAEIRFSIENSETLEDACWLLTEMANSRGGGDNITLVLARFDSLLANEMEENMVMYPQQRAAGSATISWLRR
ncbi:MAG: PP2C family serine/threonine-protein phosphatase [Blastocatellales bacterium]